MARHRQTDKHLPSRMYLKHGGYYFQNPTTRRWEPLGRDLGEALAAYGKKVGGQWQGRTLGDVIDRYRVEVLPLKRAATTRESEARQLDRLKAVFGDVHPDAISTKDCYRYADVRRGKDGQPVLSAARHEIALLGHIFSKAIKWGLTSQNPVRAMEKATRPRRQRYVTDEEFLAVRARAPERIQIAMDLALLTGLRRGDILALTRANLTDEGIVVTTSKTGAGLILEWTPELRAVVERAKRLKPQVPGTYLLRTRAGRPYSAQGFSAIWKRAVTRAVEKDGIAHLTFHDLRRKSASDSATVQEAQARLGHSSEAVTRRFYIEKPVKVRPLR